MSRLVAFGCSFTYGHGLDDCVGENGSPGPTPSKYAWPQVCANALKVPSINMSGCGYGNKHIAYKALNFDYDPDDIVIIMWSFLHRHSIMCSNDKILNLHPGNIFNSTSSDESKASKEYYESPYLSNKNNQLVENLMYISLVDYYLKSKNVHVIHTTFPAIGNNILRMLSVFTENHTVADIKNHFRTQLRRKTQSDHIVENFEQSIFLIELKKWNNFNIDLIFNDMRQGGSLDCGHPNQKSHKFFGKRLSKYIMDTVLKNSPNAT